MPYREPARAAVTTGPPLPRRYRPRSQLARIVSLVAPMLVALFSVAQIVAIRVLSDAHQAWTIPCLAIVCIVSGTWVVFQSVREQRGLAALKAREVVKHRDPTASVEFYERLLDRYADCGNIHAVMVNNLATALYAKGEIDRALAMLDAIEARGWTGVKNTFRAAVQQNRGRCLAVLGDTDGAKRCAREARLRLSAEVADVKLFSLEVLIAARSGKLADVIARTSSAPPAQSQLRMIRILRAYALAEIAPASEARDETVRQLIDGVKPLAPGELYFMVAHWPELEAFLSTRGFGAALARA